MPLFSDHINNMYYGGSSSYSASPYSGYSAPLGSSYSASYLNPGGNYSKHSSLAGYSRAPLTPRWNPGTGRNYSPLLTTISERSTSSPLRIHSPRRIPYTQRSYGTPSYTPKPIHINTADIDVSRDRYRPKTPVSTTYTPAYPQVSTTSEITPPQANHILAENENPFMPRVDGNPETGNDPTPSPQRSTIRRGRTVVRLHTIKRKDRDSPRKAEDTTDVTAQPLEEKNNEFDENLGWRDKLSEDLVYKDKREKKTLGAKLVEKFIVKDKNEDDVNTNTKRDSPKKSEEIIAAPIQTKTASIPSKSPDRRCSMEMLAEQATLLDSLIRSENLSVATLDLTKVGVADEANRTPELLKSNNKRNSLQTTRSEHSLHDRINSFKDDRDKQFSKKRSLKKSASGGSIRRLDSITEFPRESSSNTNLPAIAESRNSIKSEAPPSKLKKKPKITSSVEVTPQTSPLKFKVDKVTVEEIPKISKIEISYISAIDESPVKRKSKKSKDFNVSDNKSRLSVSRKGNKSDIDAPSPEPDDGNFWSKIGKRETVYLLKRKQNIEEEIEKNRRAMFWFPEEEMAVDAEEIYSEATGDKTEQDVGSQNLLPLATKPVAIEQYSLEVRVAVPMNNNEIKAKPDMDLSNHNDKIMKTPVAISIVEEHLTFKAEPTVLKQDQTMDGKKHVLDERIVKVETEKKYVEEVCNAKEIQHDILTTKVETLSEAVSQKLTDINCENSELECKKTDLDESQTEIIGRTIRQEPDNCKTKENDSSVAKGKIDELADSQNNLMEQKSKKLVANELENDKVSEDQTTSEDKNEIKNIIPFLTTETIVKNKKDSVVDKIECQKIPPVDTVDKSNITENIKIVPVTLSKPDVQAQIVPVIKNDTVKIPEVKTEIKALIAQKVEIAQTVAIKAVVVDVKAERKIAVIENKPLNIKPQTQTPSEPKKISPSASNNSSAKKLKPKTKVTSKVLAAKKDEEKITTPKVDTGQNKPEQVPQPIVKQIEKAALEQAVPADVKVPDSKIPADDILTATSKQEENIPENNMNIENNSSIKTKEVVGNQSKETKIAEEVKQPIVPVVVKKPVKDEPALRPLIATPRPLQKKAPQVIHSSSSSTTSSEDETSSEEENADSSTSEESNEFYECENNPDGRTSTGSNDSGFDSSAPTSPAGFIHIKKDCDVNCHRKCEKLTANLCGVNQRLLVEALASRTASRRGGEPTPAASTSAAQAHPTNSPDVSEQELESSTAYGIFRKTGRFTPPARSIPRFRKYNVEDFHFIKVLGKGSFGKVLLAELRDTEYYYAVKCLKKDVVLEDDDVECTLIERKVLALGTNHPYLCHLFATFQTDSHLFFVMEYLNGGDLMFHIQQSGRFPEARSRFYAAEIVSGLKFLHKRGIVYRDLKLDNILLDYEGHVRIADFGMCKLQIFLDKTADTFCGTPDYMAPEIIKGLKYNQTVDWWSFGVLLYEMLIGQSPFSGCDEDELFWSICNEMPSYPRFLSQEALTILTRLLDKDARTRLGGTDCMHGDVRDQEFFRSIHWDRLDRRELETPFKPRVRHPLDTQYFDKAFTGERPRLTAVEPQVLRSMDQAPFRGFSYTNPNATDR